MRRYVCWLVCGLCLVSAGVSSAADSISIPLSCKGLQASGAGQQRIQVSDSGFSILPPQGENWCVRSMSSQGFGGLKILSIICTTPESELSSPPASQPISSYVG